MWGACWGDKCPITQTFTCDLQANLYAGSRSSAGTRGSSSVLSSIIGISIWKDNTATLKVLLQSTHHVLEFHEKNPKSFYNGIVFSSSTRTRKLVKYTYETITEMWWW